MKFCPNCEIRLKRSESKLVCSKCDYVEGESIESKKWQVEENDSDFLVMGESDMNDAKGLVSTIEIDCEKCGNKEGVWWSLQTRSADEPETRFYRCIKCNYTWRDYT